MTNELRQLLGEAIVAWATDLRAFRGDRFATERELESIKSDPLGFADLLKGADAYEFFREIVNADQRREDLTKLTLASDGK